MELLLEWFITLFSVPHQMAYFKSWGYYFPMLFIWGELKSGFELFLIFFETSIVLLYQMNKWLIIFLSKPNHFIANCSGDYD